MLLEEDKSAYMGISCKILILIYTILVPRARIKCYFRKIVENSINMHHKKLKFPQNIAQNR